MIGRELKNTKLDGNFWHTLDTNYVVKSTQPDTVQNDPITPQHDTSATVVLRHTFMA